MKKFLSAFILITVAVALVAILSTPKETFAAVLEKREDLIEHDFSILLPNLEESSYISYTNFRSNLDVVISNSNHTNEVLDYIDQEIINSNKIIRIDSANELNRLSVDASYVDIYYELETTKLDLALRNKLLTLDYALGNDIDYSVMKSKQFIPLGYSFSTIDAELHEQYFEGTFNGMGFSISNLYVAGFNALHIMELDIEQGIETVITPYYAMFTHNEGVITNFGLINPTFELRTEHDDLTKASNIVGLNKGLVEKVYVVDDRTSQDAGFRMKTQVGATTNQYEASGIVFENSLGATFKDSYFAARVVVNQSNINNFKVQPVLFKNEGTQSNLVYDSQIYLQIVTVGSNTISITPASSLHIGETTTKLKNDSILRNSFYHYPLDGYPKLIGLPFDNDTFEISNAFEFLYFNKMIDLQSNYLNKPYRSHNYKLVNDIDFNDLTAYAYKTPEVVFNGKLSGLKSAEENYHIYNLEIKDGVSIAGINHLGLFSVLSGSVENISFVDFNINYQNADNFMHSSTYIGSIAAVLDQGKLNNVLVDTTITFEDGKIGSFVLGGLVGLASGEITKAYVEGFIDVGVHEGYDSTSNKEYIIGGIVGKTSNYKLTIYDALNRASINGFGTNSDLKHAALSYLGGVIGYVENKLGQVNDFGLITNQGRLIANEIQTESTVTQYIAGVIAESKGLSYILNDLSGLWVNEGILDLRHLSQNSSIVSGIVNSVHDNAVEFIYLENREYAEFLVGSYTHFTLGTLLNHRGDGNITLSQSFNAMDVYFTKPLNHNYSGVFHNEKSTVNTLRYVENKGNIIFTGFTTNQNFVVAGITTALTTNYLNVIQSGEIALYQITFNPAARPTYTSNNLSNTYEENLNENLSNIWVSGITKTLSPGYMMKNALNDGAIYIADITATQNIYVGGLVNQNNSGDLHSKDGQAAPKATIGIINSINNADIKSTLPSWYVHNISGIFGIANTYVGGITTFNAFSSGGSIQDTVNMGDLEIINKTADSPDTNGYIAFGGDSVGGSVTNFRYGVVLGGISSASNHGTSRIYDSVNSGNIISISRHFARSGGILGIALSRELQYGNVHTNYFSTESNSSNANNILKSRLSNGLNYGNISALTFKIGEYNPATTTTAASTTYFTRTMNGSGTNITGRFLTTNFSFNSAYRYKTSDEERPGVHAAAGGVIGYGLSTMSKMLNHGQISSTDVAGGVVGATVVAETLTVNIDTAINYGTVRAVKIDIINILFTNGINYTQIKNNFYDVNDSFIFPTVYNEKYLSLIPGTKRGIGGVFGRLQRGTQKQMTATGGLFDFIVNMDPNVDLIGRLDQYRDFTYSNGYFIFTGDKYYSAKYDDSTQAIFTGFLFKAPVNNNPVTWSSVQRNVEEIARYAYKLENNTLYRMKQHYVQNVVDYEMSGGTTYLNSGTGAVSTYSALTSRIIGRNVLSGSWVDKGSWEVTTDAYEMKPSNNYSDPFNITVQYTNENRTQLSNLTSTTQRFYFGSKPIPFVNEGNSVQGAINIYDENFVMRSSSATVGTEAISSYVYYVPNQILSDRFKSNRPNGMYVLATTAGSEFGSTLPANIKIQDIYRLDGYLKHNVNYNEINTQNKKALEQDIIDEYLSLYQTAMNDKSKLLLSNQHIKIQNPTKTVTIYGNQGSINNTTNRIDLRLNLQTTSATGNNVALALIQALIPEEAKIAKTFAQSGYTNPETYRQLLLAEGSSQISTNYKPEFNINLTASTTAQNIGSFTSYSEASLKIPNLLLEPYITTYTVYVTVYSNSNITPSIYRFYPDNIQNTSNLSLGAASVEIATPFNQSFNMIFRATSGNNNNNFNTSIITHGYDIKDSFKLQYESSSNTFIDVPSTYYELSTIPYRSVGNATTHEFELSLKLSDELKGGRYRIVYRYTTTDRYIIVTKNKSADDRILALAHDMQPTITLPATNFTTYVDFDASLENFQGASVSTVNPNIPLYLENYNHNIPFLTHLQLPQFARITSVTVSGIQLDSNNYRYRLVTYVVTAENGDTATYYHTIKERPIEITQYYTDSIVSDKNNLIALREASQTIFGLSFNFNQNLLNQIMHLNDSSSTQYFDIEVSASHVNGDIKGITYSISNNLNITMSDETLPGTYEFVIRYVRDNTVISINEEIIITKKPGTSSYLTDIKFSENSLDTDYAKISVINYGNQTVDISKYSPSIYFAGIDYDGADLDGIRHFRIDGEVANIPLVEYSPYMLDYLPKGATIARYSIEDQIYLDEVSIDSSDEIKNTLKTDFNMEDLVTNEPIIVTYRVTSEYGGFETYYHVTVVDKDYNFSIIFEVYYGSVNDDSKKLELSRLHNHTIAITVTNFIALDALGNEMPFTENHAYPYPTVHGSSNIVSEVTMFYSGVNENNYKYRFGKNKSGYFNFDVYLPEDNLSYQITQDGNTLQTTPIYGGKYYYIMHATRNRNKTFKLYIFETPEAERLWGLNDYHTNWK